MREPTVPPARPTRQAFPRWHIVQDERPAGGTGAAGRPTAKILPFPGRRGPAVLTYPRALVVPKRARFGQVAPTGGRSWQVRLLATAGLAGVVAALIL